MKYDINLSMAESCFYLDKTTFQLFWKKRPANHFVDERYAKIWNTKFAGKPAGSIDNDGYVVISFKVFGEKRKILRAHRIIWLLVNKQNAKYTIDHINGNPSDNRIENLRDVKQSVNCKNARISSKNTSGKANIGWSKQKQKWRLRFLFDGKEIHGGFFTDIEEADKRAREMQTELGFHENHRRSAPTNRGTY